MISGAVSGGTIGIFWIVGLLVYIYRSYRRRQQVRSAGLRNHRELDILPPKPEAYILPPDPAIIEGFLVPGERVVPGDPRADGDGKPKYVRTEPLLQSEKDKERSKLRRGHVGHAKSAPQLPTLEEQPSPPASLLSGAPNQLSAVRSLPHGNTHPHECP